VTEAGATSRPPFLKRPLLAVLAALWLGSAAARFWPAALAPPPGGLLLGLSALGGLIAAGLAYRRPRFRLIWPLLPFFLLGWALGLPFVRPPDDPGHVSQLIGRPVVITGTVVGPAEARDWGAYCLVEAESALDQGRERPALGRLRLLVLAQGGEPPRLRYGQRIRFAARLSRITDFANGQPFSYARYMADRLVFVRATLRDPRQLVVLAESGGLAWRRWLEAWRETCRRRLAGLLPPDRVGLLQALLLGDKAGVEPQTLEAFRATGTAHLLVVSGLHLGLVALLAYLGFRLLLGLALRPRQGRNLILPCRLLALAPTLAYAALSGFGVPTWRAFILVAAALLGLTSARVRDLPSYLAAAALIISLVWPPAPLDLGFQMSFVAVAALAWLGAGLEGVWAGLWARRPWRRAALYGLGLASSSLAASLALAPLLARAFFRIPLAGVALNLVVVPLYTLAAIPIGLLGLGLSLLDPALGGWALALAGRTAAWGAGLVSRAAEWPGMSLQVVGLTRLEVGLAYGLLLGLGLLISRRRLGLILLGLSLVGGLADGAFWWHRLHNQDVVLTVLDVGQGASLLLKAPGGRTWLIDGGGFHHSDFDLGRAVVAPALWSRKVGRLEAVVLTHPHPDHYKGLRFVVQNFSPRSFIYPGQPCAEPDFLELAAAVERLVVPRLGPDRLRAGLDLGGLEVRALWPPRDFPGRRPRPLWFDNLNETSLVLKFSSGRMRFLLAADIEAEAEAELCRLHDQGVVDLAAEVLYVPHHGGRTSSSRAFLSRVKPGLALISCGAGNPFALPHPETLTRLAEAGARVYRTDHSGAIRLVWNGLTLKVEPTLRLGGRVEKNP